MLGVTVDEPSIMYGDNQSVVLKTTLPSSVLKNKQHACTYHCVREAIVAKIIVFKCIICTENVSDVLTKSLENQTFHASVKPNLFRNHKLGT